jgi:hypothetical protein
MKRKRTPRVQTSKEFSDAVGRALRRAARLARKTVRMHGTPIHIWKDGKVVAEKPLHRRPGVVKLIGAIQAFLNSANPQFSKRPDARTLQV